MRNVKSLNKNKKTIDNTNKVFSTDNFPNTDDVDNEICDDDGEVLNLEDRSYGLNFIDSFNFMSTSLDSLSQSLVKSNHNFKC